MANQTPIPSLVTSTCPRHFNIVALEVMLSGLPTITVPEPHTFSLTTYERTVAADVGLRLRDADIAIITTVPVRAEALSPAATPRLKLIAAIASGTDTIDINACRARNIVVLNSPACNIDAVAEHAVGLYFACRRNMVPSMHALQRGSWLQAGTLIQSAMTHGQPVRGCAAETAVIIGLGGVGSRVAELLRALGMTVLVAGRKGEAEAREGRVAFDAALRIATVVVLCCPRVPSTLNLLSAAEFETMQRDCIVVNVSRGGIVDELALLRALQEEKIAGAGVDVFSVEPAGPATSPLLAPEIAASGINLVTTPHTAWVAAQTVTNNHRVLLENIHGFIAGNMRAERIRA